MVDSDLARIYGVSARKLSQQFKRNPERFPKDFAFQLTAQEVRNMRSEFVTSSRRNLRRPPVVFTEHGALMLASVLNCPVAIEANVRAVRAFVWLREQLYANAEVAQKLNELENRVSGRDDAIKNLFEAIRQLVEPPVPENRKQIGFMRETAPGYRIRRSCRR